MQQNLKVTAKILCSIKKVYDIQRMKVLWEQEIYDEFQYKAVIDVFHTFEGDHSVVGLSFARQDEARLFFHAVNRRITSVKEVRARS